MEACSRSRTWGRSTVSSRKDSGVGSRPRDVRQGRESLAAPRRLVVDANIVIAAFLRDSTVRRIVTLSVLELLAPEFLRAELDVHMP
ncbi:MAG: hypothetical protein E6K61_12110 [Nitrospirae bacterium]|nr:MAG: hypothetical protein E6K61_12110 [Nitrospirota bacterium]